MKTHLVEACAGAGRPDTVIRIACQELESWYLGDPHALAGAFGDDRLSQIGERALFRNPDAVGRPSSELKRIVPRFQKKGGARLMGKHL